MLFFVLNADDCDKLDLIYEKFRRPLVAYIATIIKDQHLREDVLQTVFVKIIKNLDKVGEIEAKETRNYLYRIAKTTSIDFYNAKKNKIMFK